MAPQSGELVRRSLGEHAETQGILRFAGQRQHRQLPLHRHLFDREQQRRNRRALRAERQSQHYVGDQHQPEHRYGVRFLEQPPERKRRFLQPQDFGHAVLVLGGSFDGLFGLLRQRGRHGQPRRRGGAERRPDPHEKRIVELQPEPDPCEE